MEEDLKNVSKVGWASWVSLVVKNLPANTGDIRDMSSSSWILELENPWTEESGRLQSIW